MTALIYELSDLPVGSVTPERWTAIIPAAGRGSRLGSDQPKILYPILGRPILFWLLDALAPVCNSVVLVVSPEGCAAVEAVVQKMTGKVPEIVIQNHPTGMADAVRLAAPATRTDFALVVWGDQVTLRSDSIKASVAFHENRPDAVLTLPTVMKENPYIDIERYADGRLAKVLQAREGEIERAVGENDCGLFLFTAKDLFRVLANSRGMSQGQQTGEENLLQLLPAFESGPSSVATVRLSDPNETLGVNTVQEAEMAAKVLSDRSSPTSSTERNA